MNKESDYELEAIKLLRTSNEGVLTTISDKFEGYPFGSFITSPLFGEVQKKLKKFSYLWLNFYLIQPKQEVKRF